MRTFLKSFVGAAMLLSASVASAQDYTWTLSDFWFDKYGTFPGPYTTSEFGTTATGTIVLSKDGSDYVLKSYNFTTTEGAAGITAVYDSASNENFGTDGGVAFQTFIDMYDIDDEVRFRIVWYSNSLIDEMDSDNVGAEVELPGNSSREYLSSGLRRYNGVGNEVCELNQDFEEVCLDLNAGIMTLTSVTQVATPEPASMAVLGAGLLGLFAARRRRAA